MDRLRRACRARLRLLLSGQNLSTLGSAPVSLPPLICFTSDDAHTELVFAWLGAAAQLVDEGMRVLLANADPTGTVERMFPEVEQVIRRTGGSGLMNLLHNVEARPELIDLKPLQESFFGRVPAHGALVLLPAHRVHEAPDPSLAQRTPEESRAAARAIRGQLWENDRFDIVLALLPPGPSPLGTALLEGCADLAVHLRVAPPPASDEPPRGPKIVPMTLGNSYAQPERLLFPPMPMIEGDPPRTYLRDGPLIRRSELLVERLRACLHQHPRLLRARFQDGVRRQDWACVEESYGALWAASRDEALDLFQEQMLRGIKVPRQIGASALRAVVQRPDVSRADLLHIASHTVQTFRWSRPSADAELSSRVLERLLAGHLAGDAVALPGRLLVDTASSLCHLVLWKRQCGATHEETWPIILRIHELLGQRTRTPMRLADEVRWARAAGTFTRLTGDSAFVNELRDCLDLIALHLPNNYLRTASLSLLFCAIGLQRVEMLEEVIAACDQLIPQEPVIGLYRRAAAWAHMGFYGDAIMDLHELAKTDREASLEALTDPDFRPLWSVAGDPNLTVPRPR